MSDVVLSLAELTGRRAGAPRTGSARRDLAARFRVDRLKSDANLSVDEAKSLSAGR
jgi:hypothetical protein